MNNHTDLQPNRRLRNRMSGGVRGRGLVTLSCSIKKHLTNLIKYDIIQLCGCVGMADEGDSKSLAVMCMGSSPIARTNNFLLKG